MTTVFSHEPSVHHLLDILGCPPGKLPERARNAWPEVFDLARKQRIYHWLIYQALQRWSDTLPPEVQTGLRHALERNRARNLFLANQICELAASFRNAGMTPVFLKGAACLARGIYPAGGRYLSDIDLLIPPERESDARRLLVALGYYPTPEQIVLHHIAQYSHAGRAGALEVHRHPYSRCIVDNTPMKGIRRDADRIIFHDIEILVPSATDHLWILLMTDLAERSFLPHLGNALEASLILRAGCAPDFDVLAARARREQIPNAVPGLSHGCFRYFGMPPFAESDCMNLRRWELHCLDLQRGLARGSVRERLHTRFAAIMFLSSKGFAPKIRLLVRLLRYDIPFESANAGTPSARWLTPFRRTLRDAAGFAICLARHLLRCCFMKHNLPKAHAAVPKGYATHPDGNAGAESGGMEPQQGIGFSLNR